MNVTKSLLPFGAIAVGLALLFHFAAHRAPPPLPPEPASAAPPSSFHRLTHAQAPAGPTGFSLSACLAALHSSKPDEIQSAFKALMDYLAQNPDETSTVLAALEQEADYPRFITWLAQLAGDHPTAPRQQVFKRWALELAQAEHSLPAQQTALALLGHVGPEAELLPVLTNVFHNTTDHQVQVTALVTLKAWSEQQPDATLKGLLTQSLVEMVNSASDQEVRQRGFEALARVGLPDATLMEASDLLWQEPAEANRSLLAMAFEQAGQPARDFALGKLEQACTQATDLETQRAALAQIVRLAKAQSTPILQRLSAMHPALQADVDEYLQILREGAVEIALIDRRKLELEAAGGL